MQSPRLGGLWWSAWELEKGKLWLEYEWNHGRGGEQRGKKRGEEKGGLWLNYSQHRGWQRRTFSVSAQAWAPLPPLSRVQLAATWKHAWDKAAAASHRIIWAELVKTGRKGKVKRCWRARTNRYNGRCFKGETLRPVTTDELSEVWMEAGAKLWPQQRISLISAQWEGGACVSLRTPFSLCPVICLLEPYKIGQVQPPKGPLPPFLSTHTPPAQTDVYCFCWVKRPQLGCVCMR